MLDFPDTPVDGEQSTQPNGITYEWQAAKTRWVSVVTAGGGIVAGTVVQEQSIQDGVLAQGTTIFPTGGNSIPVNTDGDEYMTIDFTPKYATSVLRVDVVWNGSNDVAVSNRQGMGLFQDAIVDALAATQSWADNAGESMIMSLTNFVAATDTALRTFKVRAGSNTAGTTDFNGTSGTQRFGGVYASTITVTEIQPEAVTVSGSNDFDDKLAGYLDTGLHAAFAGDLNTILINSTFLVGPSNANLPADWIGQGFCTTTARDINNATQMLWQQNQPGMKWWSRKFIGGAWGAWQVVVDGNDGRVLFGRVTAAGAQDRDNGGVTVAPSGTAGEYVYTFDTPRAGIDYTVQVTPGVVGAAFAAAYSFTTVDFKVRMYNTAGTNTNLTHAYAIHIQA